MHKASSKRESVGVIHGFIQSGLWGVFPVLVHQGVQGIPPLTFAALSTLFACLPSFLWMLYTRSWHEYRERKNIFFPLIIVALCSQVLPYGILFYGATLTTGVNTSMLLMTEVIFLMIFTHFIGERTTLLKVVGAVGVFVGAVIIMSQDGVPFRAGDILIIASTVPYFFGNFYGKKLLNVLAPQTIMVFRFLVGGGILLLAAFLLEGVVSSTALTRSEFVTIAVNGILLIGINKIFWYESFRRLDISKAVLIAMTFPLFSLIALLAVGEQISLRQWIGSVIMIVGVFATIIRPSVDPLTTKYARL